MVQVDSAPLVGTEPCKVSQTRYRHAVSVASLCFLVILDTIITTVDGHTRMPYITCHPILYARQRYYGRCESGTASERFGLR